MAGEDQRMLGRLAKTGLYNSVFCNINTCTVSLILYLDIA